MNPTPPPPSDRVPRNALIVMGIVLVVMALVSLYANVQRLRRDKLETVIITPAATPSPSPVKAAVE